MTVLRDTVGIEVEGVPSRVYIPEIQGLRTLAALLVAIYHIWFNRVSGGVDVFFVVAAFFMMTTFAKRGDLRGADLLRYWSSTVRRVCPVMATVICATLLALYLFDMRIVWNAAIFHAAASAVFFENWWLAISGTDYLNSELPPSAFQQMWALSLQMQVAIGLPAVLWLAGPRGWTPVLSVLAAASFGYALWITQTNQLWGYFDSLARIWEFAIGALLALHIARIPKRWAVPVLGLAAVVVMATFAAVLPVARLFPGVAALIPAMCTVTIIYVAYASIPIAPLRWGPMIALGNISFAFYLWHWPILILWRHLTGEDVVNLPVGLGIIASAGILGALSVWLVEGPVRRAPKLRASHLLGLLSGVAAIAISLAAVGLSYMSYRGHKAQADAQLAAFQRDPVAFAVQNPQAITPDPMIVRRLWRPEYGVTCHQRARGTAEVLECHHGKPDGARTLVLHGGSHSVQWLPALEALSDELDLRIIQITKMGCPTFDGDVDPGDIDPGLLAYFQERPPSCAAWNAASKARILEIAPDVVLAIATRGQGPAEAMPENYQSWWRSMSDAGVGVLALRDNPWFFEDVPACVDRNRRSPGTCDKPRSELLAENDPGTGFEMPNVTYLDLSDLFCDAAACWAVRDGVLVYRDGHHITGTFARKVAQHLHDPLAAMLSRPAQ